MARLKRARFVTASEAEAEQRLDENLIKGTDHAIWRRIRLIPFEVTIPEKERDPGLLDKLLGEAEDILAWAVAGCLRWHAEGLGIPAAVRKATEGYRSQTSGPPLIRR